MLLSHAVTEQHDGGVGAMKTSAQRRLERSGQCCSEIS